MFLDNEIHWTRTSFLGVQLQVIFVQNEGLLVVFERQLFHFVVTNFILPETVRDLVPHQLHDLRICLGPRVQFSASNSSDVHSETSVDSRTGYAHEHPKSKGGPSGSLLFAVCAVAVFLLGLELFEEKLYLSLSNVVEHYYI